MEKIDKLYRITLRGMTYSATGVVEGISYVVARDAEEAYQKVRKSLDMRDVGFTSDRELKTIELLAENNEHIDAGHRLYL